MLAAAVPRSREESIRRERARAAYAAVVSTMTVAQLLFWSFALGAAQGPVPLHPGELVSGSLFAFALGATFSWPFVKRRLEEGSGWSCRIEEEGRRRRLVFFDEYLTIDQDVVLRSALDRVELRSGVLTITYHEDGEDEVTQRMFSGPYDVLERARAALSV